MKKTLSIFGLLAVLAISTIVWQSCKKSSSTNSSSSAVALTILTGAQSVIPGSVIPYTAVFVDSKGNTTTPAASDVTWTLSGTGLGTFAGNILTCAGTGAGTITATAKVNGTTLTASVPIGIASPTVFAVVPSAIVWTTGAGTIPLTPVYIGTGTTGYTYSCDHTDIATVDANGNISFVKAGSCVITVTASGLSGSPTVAVPVLVVGMPPVSLPIMRVAVTPTAPEMFRGDTKQLTATGYDMNNAVKSSTFTWTSQDPSIATVDNTGKVTAIKLGRTIITATTSGIVGQAEVDVLPDTALLVTPFFVSLSASATKQFTAKAYKVSHDTSHTITEITGFSSYSWSIPTYGMPIFDIATVNTTGLVTMKSTATAGMATFLLATATSPTIQPGVAMIMVSMCDCGTTDAGVASIYVPSSSITLSIMGSQNLGAEARDSGGTAVSGANLHYCCDAMAVCNVDPSGNVTAISPGTATITICNGSISTTVTVTVQ